MRKGHGFRGSAPWGDIWRQGGRSFSVANARDSDVGGLAEGWEGSQAVQTHGLVVRTAGLQARRAGSSFPAEGGREGDGQFGGLVTWICSVIHSLPQSQWGGIRGSKAGGSSQTEWVQLSPLPPTSCVIWGKLFKCC